MATKKLFKKNDKIKANGKKFQCICHDGELAVFAPFSKNRDGGTRTYYRDIFVVSNVNDAAASAF